MVESQSPATSSVYDAATKQDEPVRVAVFDESIASPDYEDYVDIRNYQNVTLRDKVEYYKFRYFGGDVPVFMKKNLLRLPRRVYVQTPLPEDMVVRDQDRELPKYAYPRNKIRTTKYTPLNFIPKNLFFQFQNVANGYFLFVCILGAFQIFGVSSPGLNAVPLIVIVFLTALRDAFEDSRRALSDEELNNSRVHLVTGLDNPNVVVDNVGPWRRFKKANSRALKKVLYNYIIPLFKKQAPHTQSEKQTHQRASLETVDSFTTSHRLSVQMSRSKISRAQPGTVVNPAGNVTGAVKFRNKAWKDIYVGDIVRIRQNEEVPADVVVLSTSLEEQNCYIETKNLDGETNLKLKKAVKAGNGLKYGNDIERMQCWVECDSPNPNLYSFKGVMHYPAFDDASTGDKTEAVTLDNVLFRGSTLRNTRWVIGLVLYTGSETKIMLNSGITPTKKSKIARELNVSVYINFGLLFVLCFVSGVINGIFYNKKHVSRLYYEFKPYNDSSAASGVVAFFVALILYQSLVPISLYVSVEIIKTAQAFFIWSDVKMYYEALDYPCVPKSWNISDDLGQVEYIFSDKTGTLTQNVMEFKKCSVGLRNYGMCYTEAKMGMQKRLGVDVVKEKVKMDRLVAEDKQLMLKLISDNKTALTNGNEHSSLSNLAEEDVSFISSDYVKDVLSDTGNKSQKPLNEWFMTALALCHTAVTEIDEGRRVVKAESPDENALVGVARDLGIEFLGRKRDTMFVEKYGIEHQYKVLSVIPFSSTRKRMSIVVEMPRSELPGADPESGTETATVLISKGADSVIYERLRGDSDEHLLRTTALYLEQFSKEGLRTLCVAYSELPRAGYEEWARRYHEAGVSLDGDREARMEDVAAELERDLTLLGSTAIEDRLQDDVPDSIATLGKAGIKLWVLTGDKIETAINIGFSCNLLGSEMKLLVVGNGDADYGHVNEKITRYLKEEFGVELNDDASTDAALQQAREDHSTPENTHAVVVDGAVLGVVFDEHNTTLQKKFLLLCKQCRAVLCCRVSPAQKAQVVGVVKQRLGVMTLAIGDGANDVAMIQAANIGVGIAGAEGRQAVMSSDYGLGQFRYLTRLVLVHGRWSYKRLAEMIPCFFYKNVVFTLTLFWYGIFADFDGTYLYEFTFIMFYNLAFTSLPIIFLAVFDQDVSDTVSLLVPELYRSGILGKEWSQYKFVLYMLDGIYQSVLSFFFPYLIYYTGRFVASSGLPLHHRFWMGIMVSAISVISCNIYVLLQQNRWDWLSLIIYAFSILVLFFWAGIWSSSTYSGEFYKSAAQVFGAVSFWAVFFLGVLCNLLPRFTFDTIRRLYWPKDIDIIRERVNIGCYNNYPLGYDPTDANDVQFHRNLDGHSDSKSIDSENLISSTPPKNISKPLRKPTITETFKHPIGTIKRLKKPNSLSLQQMRQDMIQSGDYVGSTPSLSNVPGLSQAESLMSVHSRRSRY